MKTCINCSVPKKIVAYVGSSDVVCRLCKSKKEVEKASRFAEKKAYISEKNISEFEEITVFSKNVSNIFKVRADKFEELSKKYVFKRIEEREVYCTEYMDEFKEDTLAKTLILERDDYICQYCGEEGITIDHIYPQSQGGADHPINYLTACEECNLAKADVILDNILQMKSLVKSFRNQVKLKTKKREYGRSMYEISQEKTRIRNEKYNQSVEKVSWIDIQSEKEKEKASKGKSSLDDMLTNAFKKSKHTEKWR